MENNDIHEKDPAFGEDYHSVSDRVENNVKDTVPKGEQVLVLTDSKGEIISTVGADEKITVGLEPAETIEKELDDLVKDVDGSILRIDAGRPTNEQPDFFNGLSEVEGQPYRFNEEDVMKQPIAEAVSQYGRSFGVNPLSVGYRLTIGCQDFAVETPEMLVKILTAYILNPERTEDLFNATAPRDRYKIFD